MLTAEIITGIIENHSEVSGCPNNCNKLISSPSCLTMKLPMILLWKGTSAPVAPLLKGQRRKCSRHASILQRPCAYYSTRTLFSRCRLQCLTVMNINYQRSPETEQFITAKISGNALKQGSTRHSVLRQRSPQLQKYKAAPMSRRIVDDQNVCGGDGGHPGLIASP